jgi:hypothetical protein
MGMTDTIKQYNDYLGQIEMILHPNLFNAFLKIHNKLLEESVEQAKSFKPSTEWIELKKDIDKMKNSEKSFRPLYIKSILKKIEKLPEDKSW